MDMADFDLGQHRRAIATASPAAQRYFDLGLNWCFGFNHEEGVACFRKALEHDPGCAMAHWGIAYGLGPFYNLPWRHLSKDEADTVTQLCHGHLAQAARLTSDPQGADAALIEALQARVQAPHAVNGETFDRWDRDYRDAMRAVHRRFPEDADVAALFVEALITRTPWRLWDVKTGQPAAGADTLEALEVCEAAMARLDAAGQPAHPALLHLHIHTLEMSDTPERAMRSADLLGTLCPDAGHMNHMPGHIYVLCGAYDKARIASERAIAADDLFLDYAGPYNFYTTARCHDLHLMMYTCMMLGQFAPAIQAADRICETLSPDVLGTQGHPQMIMTMEGYYSMRMHVLVRFGRWPDIVEAAMPPDTALYCVSTAMHHYAKGVALAALGRFDEAQEEQSRFRAARRRVPAERKFFNNAAVDILGVAEAMLAGELAYHVGDHDEAFAHLREAVRRDDNLAYTEPWAWMHPPRHALGALLAEQGRFEEAEAVYRADLGLNAEIQRCAQHADNVWALHGFVECLQRSGDRGELPVFEARLAAAVALADPEVTSSCLCRTQPAALSCCGPEHRA